MTRVLKLGGRAQQDPELAGAIAAAWREDPRLIVIHGGGDEITSLQRALGREPTFINGRRVTTQDDLALVRMVLSGAVNKRLVGELTAAGVPAVGISGEDGDLLSCDVFENGAYGAVGVPGRVNSALIETLLQGGFMPVISPVGRFAETGTGCNVNGDDAAAAIAGALGAHDLMLLADVSGVLGEDGRRIEHLDRADALTLIREGTAKGGMIAKLEAAIGALDLGVRSVRIGDLHAISDRAAGSSLMQSAAFRDSQVP
jgi:acetylglutamate kinase